MERRRDSEAETHKMREKEKMLTDGDGSTQDDEKDRQREGEKGGQKRASERRKKQSDRQRQRKTAHHER